MCFVAMWGLWSYDRERTQETNKAENW
jgi:hypothetical protein